MFKPKLYLTLKNYSRHQFLKDIIAGILVGIVALPLAIAFAIASGVSPEKGIYTAIVAGFIISALGGSRVQIGGPTGAFIVIVYGIVQQYGINGLVIATFMAGFMLMIMGLARLGNVIKFIPHPLIVGFTTGIAVIIFSSEMKDFFGLSMGPVPANFIDKWQSYFQHLRQPNWWAVAIGFGTIIIIKIFPKITRIVPGSLIAILTATIAVQLFKIPLETIGSRFGNIPNSFPLPMIPHVNFTVIKSLIRPAFTIAILGAIESLLSAVVSDGMIGGNHKSNMELIAQGAANIGSALFGGIPATGAIARTATNVKSGGRTPVAGIMHAITLLIIILLFGKWASLIPMSCLAGILIIVAYNMSEYQTFIHIIKGDRSDAIVLITTFLLTVLFDLTLAIEIGMVLAMFLFMRKIIKISNVNAFIKTGNQEQEKLYEKESSEFCIAGGIDPFRKPNSLSAGQLLNNFTIPDGIEVFEISGPMFFGAAYKFKDAIKVIENSPTVLIVRMGLVPIIDATGIHTIKDVLYMCKNDKIQLIISELQSEVLKELKKSRLIFKIGKRFITNDFTSALALANDLILIKNKTSK